MTLEPSFSFDLPFIRNELLFLCTFFAVSLNIQVFFPQYLVKNSGIICNFKQLQCKISCYKSATRQACLARHAVEIAHTYLNRIYSRNPQ